MIAGAGDVLQGIKKGVLEVADAIAINKADGDNAERAEQARHEFEHAMHFLSPVSPSWTPPVLKCSSVIENGTRNVWETVLDHRKKMKQTGEFDEKRRSQALEWMWTLVYEGLKQRFNENRRIAEKIPEIAAKVERELISPTAAAEELLSCF